MKKNNLKQATRINLNANPAQSKGNISDRDRTDLYTFNLGQRSRIDVELTTQNGGDVDLTLYRLKGKRAKAFRAIGKADFQHLKKKDLRQYLKRVGRSRQPNGVVDHITKDLDAGTYYLQVHPKKGTTRKTKYSLVLSSGVHTPSPAPTPSPIPAAASLPSLAPAPSPKPVPSLASPTPAPTPIPISIHSPAPSSSPPQISPSPSPTSLEPPARLAQPDVTTGKNTSQTIASPTPTAVKYADLVIEYPTMPDIAVVGDRISVSAYVTNTGDASAKTSYLEYWLSDDLTFDPERDRYLRSAPVSEINTGSSEYESLTLSYDPDWGTGQRYLILRADGRDQVSESNEANNLLIHDLRVFAHATPDLRVESPSAPDSLVSNEMIAIAATVTNTGIGTADAGVVSYWLSDDAMLNPDQDIALGQSAIAPLTWNTSTDTTFTVDYDPSWGTGAKYLLLEANAETNSDRNTQDITDNIAVHPITITAPKPDLVIQEVSGPTSAIAGTSITINATIQNNGGGTAGFHSLQYRLSDDTVLSATDPYLGYDFVGQLLSGESTTETLSFDYDHAWRVGDKYILVESDRYGSVDEVDETNNISVHPISIIAPDIDLVIDQVPTSMAGVLGDSIYLNPTVKNIGKHPSGSSDVHYWLSDDDTLDLESDRYLGNSWVPSLEKNETEKELFNFTYKSEWELGTKYLFFVVDGSNKIPETDETNNIAHTTIDIQEPFIDLSINNPIIEGYLYPLKEDTPVPTVQISGTVSTALEVVNNGNMPVDSSHVRYWLSDDTTLDVEQDQYLGEDRVRRLSPGQSGREGFRLTYDIEWGWGTKYILFEADGYQVIDEQDELNNVVNAIIEVEPPSDLTISTFSTPLGAVTGDKIELQSSIQNIGQGSSQNYTDLEYWLSDDEVLDPEIDRLLERTSIDSLDVDQIHTNTFSFTYEKEWGMGTQYFFVKIDGDDENQESDETNNVVYRSIDIQLGKRDLTVNNYSVPSTSLVGDQIEVNVTLKNIGVGTLDSSYLDYWLSDDPVFDADSDLSLGSNWTRSLEMDKITDRSFTFTYDAAWGIGTKYIFFIADGEDRLDEIDETNNIAFAPISLLTASPDLMIQDYFAPARGSLGEKLTLQSTIANQGQGSFGPTVIQYWLSDDEILDKSSDHLLGNQEVSSLSTGASEEQNFSFTYDEDWGLGAKYIFFETDGQNQSREQDESNNIVSTRISIEDVALDLTVQSKFVPDTVVIGDYIRIDASVINNGVGLIDSSQLNYWLSDDEILNKENDHYLGSDDISSLGTALSSHQSVKFTYKANWSSGTKYILFEADSTGAIGEVNEENNISSQPITVLETATTNTLKPISNTDNSSIDSLLLKGQYSYKWNTSQTNDTITYSFFKDNISIYNGHEIASEIPDLVKGYVRDIFQHLETFLAVDFIEVEETQNESGTLRYMFSDGPDNAYAYFPGASDNLRGSIHLRPTDASDWIIGRSEWTAGIGTQEYSILIHEILHALGLKHPGNYAPRTPGPFLSPEEDNNSNTVMSYNYEWRTTKYNGSHALTAMPFDVRALQHLYGVGEHNAEETIYRFTNVHHYKTDDGQALGHQSRRLKQVLWDSGGINTIDFSNLTTDESYRFDLQEGGMLTTQAAFNGATYYDYALGNDGSYFLPRGPKYVTSQFGTAIAYNTTIHNLINSGGNDIIIANSADNIFSGYEQGRSVGHDVISQGSLADAVELSNYSLDSIVTTIDENDLILNLGDDGSITLKDYFNTNGAMKIKVGNTAYRQSRNGAWLFA